MGLLDRLFGNEGEKKEKPKAELFGIEYKEGSFKEGLDLEPDDPIKLKVMQDTVQAVTGKDEFINEFKIDDIVRIDLLNDEEIKSEVTAGRILAFGVFALAMKKEKSILKDRSLIITYKDGEERKTFTTTFPTGGAFEFLGAAFLGEISKYKETKENRGLRGTWSKNLIRKR